MIRSPRRRTYGLEGLRAAVSERVLEAMVEASRRLAAEGIRHAVIGALAAGMWGRPRATSDVDFLIGREWLRGEGPTPKLASDVVFLLSDIERDTGVTVDAFVVAAAPPGAKPSFVDAIEKGLRGAPTREGLPVSPPEIVVATKLLRGKAQDLADIVELLIAARIAKAKVRRFLVAHVDAPNVERFDALARQARDEAAAAKKSERVLRPARRR
jgi:hypothetical protein